MLPLIKILFIVNPKSGTDRNKRLQNEIENYLDKTLFDYEINQTEYRGHGMELARQAALNGFKIVVAVGGDGTVNDVIKGIYGTDLHLAIIPKGSGNGLARSLNIPLKTKEAIKLINNNKVLSIDLGRVNNHLFVSNAGIGFDAIVAKKFAQSKGRGLWNYIILTIQTLLNYQPKDFTIHIDQQQVNCKDTFIVSVANTQQFGYNFKIAPLADFSDGIFDIVIIQKFPFYRSLGVALKAFSGNLLKSEYVKHFTGKKITITSKEMTSLQVDGDYIPEEDKEYRYEMLHHTLKVLVT